MPFSLNFFRCWYNHFFSAWCFNLFWLAVEFCTNSILRTFYLMLLLSDINCWCTYDVHFEGRWRGVGWVRRKWHVIWRRGWGVRECSGHPILISFVKEHWICAMTRHHDEPNINILSTRNLSFDFDVRQWSLQ